MLADSVPTQRSSPAKLILSLGPDGSIVQFNALCEKVTGFTRPEVVHRPFTAMIPPEQMPAWEELLVRMSCSQTVPQFVLPLITKIHTQVPVQWNGFIISGAQKEMQSICLLGVPMDTEIAPTPSSLEFSPNQPPKPTQTESTPTPEPKQTLRQDTTPAPPAVTTQDYENLRADVQRVLQEMGSVSQLMQTLLTAMTDQSAALEKIPIALEAMQRPAVVEPAPTPVLQKPPKWSPRDPFGFKWKVQQLLSQTKQLDNRQQTLDSQQEQLLTERRLLDQRLEEFCQWKEKLKAIEESIEQRRALLEQQRTPFIQTKEPIAADTDDLLQVLETIPESAIIVQRGIIKQTNASFLTLLGYAAEDLMEKSLFDFIAGDGLGPVEKYYLDRLKGESLGGYSTVLTAKGDARVAVEVQVKPAMYHGEKAEILLVTSVNTA